MKKRIITTTIDSVLEMFRDYLPEGDIPADAKPVKMMIKPQERNKIGILIESDTKFSAPQMLITFQMKRVFGTGQ